MTELAQVKTDSLVRSVEQRIDPAARSKSSAGPTHGTTSTADLASLKPMTIEQASKLVRRLLAGYPNLGAHDPEAYIAALIQTMSEYPLWAGNRTIFKVDQHDPAFPPTEKQLRQWLDAAVGPYRFRQEWDARVSKQLAERSPINEAQPAYTTNPNIKSYRNFDEAVRVHGRPMGAFELGRERPYRG